MRSIFTIGLVLFGMWFTRLHAQDTLNVKIIDGKEFYEHRVREKETLYSLSRIYDVPIYRIIEHNPPTEFGLEIGTVIYVPKYQKEPIEEVSKTMAATPIEEPKNSDHEHKQEADRVMHTVETKQTLFSISKLYDVEVDEIREWNGLTSNALDIGQVLVIKKLPKASDLPEIEIPKKKQSDVHIVEPGDTFYSLSKRFDISVEELKELNGLVSNELSIGQELIIKSKNTNKEVVLVDTTRVALNQKVSEEDQRSIDRAIEVARKYEETSESMNFEEVVESGVAEVIQGTDNTRKYLALHRAAKAGTILKVRNDMNDQEVFVRVLGKLPDNLSNKNVLIKVSQAAYNRLGAIDPKFRVTLSYIP